MQIAAAWALEHLPIAVLGGATWLILTTGRRVAQRPDTDPRLAARQVALLLAGILIVCVTFVSPIAALRPHLFSVDMLQHVALTMFVAPMFILGGPVLRDARVPLVVHVAVARARGVLARVGRLSDARVALVVYLAVVYASLLPAVYDAALRIEPLHALLNALLLAAGLLFWRPILSRTTRRLRPGLALLYLGAAVVGQSKLLASLLVVVDRPVFAYYAEAPRVVGLSALDDQQIAAALLGLGSVIPLGLAMCVVGLAWLEQQDRLQAAREAAEDALVTAPYGSRRA